jgi:hypothetical protein
LTTQRNNREKKSAQALSVQLDENEEIKKKKKKQQKKK